MRQNIVSSQLLAADITKKASKQTYFTIRFFVDRGHTGDAYRAYGYFRWVDDVLDGEAAAGADKLAFIDRQNALLETCYRGELLDDVSPEERMLVDLVCNDTEPNSGLQTYLRNMMGVMLFDARRRGRVITQNELSEYTRMLATAVTEALYYFIGHDDPPPRREDRYLAVTAAHITHMLRDAFEDTEAGYYNLPQEYLQANAMTPQDVNNPAYREWVHKRVQTARSYFDASRVGLTQIGCLRCRLAGYAYTARFEWLLGAIERDGYVLRADYSERKSLLAGMWMGWSALVSMFFSHGNKGIHNPVKQPIQMDER